MAKRYKKILRAGAVSHSVEWWTEMAGQLSQEPNDMVSLDRLILGVFLRLFLSVIMRHKMLPEKLIAFKNTF